MVAPRSDASRHPYSIAFENPSELTISPEERILDFELEEWVSQLHGNKTRAHTAALAGCC